jgi:hypothetical protein
MLLRLSHRRHAIVYLGRFSFGPLELMVIANSLRVVRPLNSNAG